MIAERIESKLAASMTLLHLEVINESNNHNVPAGSESHFKVVLVSDEFGGCRLIERHKKVNRVLVDELKNDIHALAIHTFTLDEWRARNGAAPVSPPCFGGE